MRTLLKALAGSCLLAASLARADCSATFKQLTWKCGGVCDAFVPCVVYDLSDECDECTNDDGECQYRCLPEAYDADVDSLFRYFIPYSTAQREDANVEKYENNVNDSADTFPRADDLASIATMDLKTSTTSVYVLYALMLEGRLLFH